jgi:hypothetical protein
LLSQLGIALAQSDRLFFAWAMDLYDVFVECHSTGSQINYTLSFE